MSIEDLFVMALIAFGIFSSLLGGKKKKPPAARRRPPPSAAGATRERARVEQGRREAASQMERILRELGIEVPESEERAPTRRVELEEVPPPPPERTLPTPPVPRERPRVVSLEEFPEEAVSLEELDISGEERHDRFHERYLPSKPPPSARTTRGRSVLKYLKRSNLRQAILLKEILGPPKGLQ